MLTFIDAFSTLLAVGTLCIYWTLNHSYINIQVIMKTYRNDIYTSRNAKYTYQDAI